MDPRVSSTGCAHEPRSVTACGRHQDGGHRSQASAFSVRTMKAILHVHTFYSPDCIVPPERVVDTALAHGADLLLVTDHDDFAGARAARGEVARRGARLHIPIAAEILTELGDVIIA